ncbi:MAG: phytanoyl-CoA dioxygenase family protein [Polaribacter sp.]|uniref:phytanoyl-CoA dioxygenase family protein n=1 Tax=Polaribacter sp. TaxID=1920175 RepID=UPI003267DA4B
MKNLKTDLEIKGYCKLDQKIDLSFVEKINKNLPKIFKKHELIRRENKNPIKSNGIAINALVGSDVLLECLQMLINNGVVDWIEENYFNTHCILNSFSALSNIPGENKVFHRNVHRDIRGFSYPSPLLLNMLIMLDDFTEENGATLLLPKSHKENKKPSDLYFNNNAVKTIGKAGDILIWNSNLYHASGVNETNKIRRALPITFSLPYYKQLLDYPRAIGYDKSKEFNNKMSALLGYDARVPDKIENWYAPLDKLLYKN